jgi:hypothetical protein
VNQQRGILHQKLSIEDRRQELLLYVDHDERAVVRLQGFSGDAGKVERFDTTDSGGHGSSRADEFYKSYRDRRF